MKGQENLIPFNELTEEKQRELAIKGGKASGEARRKKRDMKEMLKMCLEMTDDEGKTYQELATIGLIKGAILGNSTNYKTILETLGELQEETTTMPTININVVDNSNLEETMYKEK